MSAYSRYAAFRGIYSVFDLIKYTSIPDNTSLSVKDNKVKELHSAAVAFFLAFIGIIQVASILHNKCLIAAMFTVAEEAAGSVSNPVSALRYSLGHGRRAQ